MYSNSDSNSSESSYDPRVTIFISLSDLPTSYDFNNIAKDTWSISYLGKESTKKHKLKTWVEGLGFRELVKYKKNSCKISWACLGPQLFLLLHLLFYSKLRH